MKKCSMKRKETGCGIRSLSSFEKTRILEALSKSTLAKPRRTKQNRRTWIRLAFYETIRFKPGGVLMRSIVFLGMTLLAASVGIGQNHPSLPSSFRATTIHSPEGADIFVRSGGRGPVVVLLHGYAENSDSWAPLAADLMKDHSVVVPDLRGIGRSSKPESGYDKKTQAKDIRAVVTRLGYDRTFVVAHDIGNMVAYAYAAMYPDKVKRSRHGCSHSRNRTVERD